MKSNFANDVLEKDPPWLVRWGILSMLMFLLILLFVSNIIAYPDINTAKVELSTLTPPTALFARTNGYIKEIFVQEGDTVADNTVLVVINNSSDLNQMIELKTWLDTGHFETLKSILEFGMPDLKMLGELQPSYNDLLIVFNEARQYSKADIYSKKISKANVERKNYQKLLTIEKKKYELISKDYQILKEEADNNEALFLKEVISSKDINEYRRLLLKKRMEIEMISSNIVSFELNINTVTEQIFELQNIKEQEEIGLLLSFNNIAKELKVAYKFWEEKYIILANTKGSISFFKQWESGEFVNVSDHILTIIPLEEQEIYATGMLPIANSGKAKIGQKVNIKLDDYPYREFGMLEGKLVYISQTQSSGYYSIKVRVVGVLGTNDEREFHWFKSNMVASAEIITDNLTLFQRLLFKLKKIRKSSE